MKYLLYGSDCVPVVVMFNPELSSRSILRKRPSLLGC